MGLDQRISLHNIVTKKKEGHYPIKYHEDMALV